MLGAEGTQKVKLVEFFKTSFGGNDGGSRLAGDDDVLEYAEARMVGRSEVLQMIAELVAFPADGASGNHGLLLLHNVRAQNQVRSVALIIWLLA